MAGKTGTKKAAAKKRAAKSGPAAKKTPSRRAPSARAAGKTVDDYVAGLSGWQAALAVRLRACVRSAAPSASESIKWGQPVYDDHGPFAYFKAFGGHVNFGFWRGAELADPSGMLEGTGERMKHVSLKSEADLDPAKLAALIREAVVLNREQGTPTRRAQRKG